MELVRTCIICKKEKDINDFLLSGPNGSMHECIECYDSNKPKIRKCRCCGIEKPLTKEFFEERKLNKGLHPNRIYYLGKCKECYKLHRKDYNKTERLHSRTRYRNNPEYQMWRRALDRSKLEKCKFNIFPEDIIIPKFCPILKLELKINDKQAFNNSPSLDKIDPKLGYTKGNIRVISRMANIMKAHANLEQLELFCKNIILYMKGEI